MGAGVKSRWTLTGRRFIWKSKTGKVLLNAHGAEFDLIQSGKHETAGGTGGSWRRTLWGEGDPMLATGSQVTDYPLMIYAESVIAEKRGAAFGNNLVGNLARGSLSFFDRGESRTGKYRLTEYCILPEHWYDVTGTCVENLKPKDEHDRNMILKGQNEPTFLISWRSEKGIESALRNRAALYIFGGAALSIACLALLLLRFGWL